ncbi:MAG: nitroreductase family deazaflavin-dependent oxidoreductase [Chloroflexota bacterium]|nr:nitroreductase family deazaflavin-dependent oxidoreductase [Chloroflexota bacterium]
MPLPYWLTRVNLVVSNRITAPFAARLPWFGVLEHVGRRSGELRRTPLTIFRRGQGRYVIALTYGPDVQWLRNVADAGTCRVKTRGAWIVLGEPRRFTDPARRAVPFVVRPILRLLRVTEFVELTEISKASGPGIGA